MYVRLVPVVEQPARPVRSTGAVDEPALAPTEPDGLGRPFAWLWAAFAVSTFGTWFAFDAFPIIAVRELHAGPAAVSALAASGALVGAVVALPLGPWVERRRKRRVMVAMDLVRAAALVTVPVAVAAGVLSIAQLVIVAVIVGAADIAFRAASGAFLKSIVAREQLVAASSRFEATQWTATMVGPPLGGAAIGALGAAVSVAVNAASFVGSALALGAIDRAADPSPAPLASEPSSAPAGGSRRAELLVGWRTILADPVLRALFVNVLAVNALIMATAPLLAVLMLGHLGFAPWQYALAFGAPCIGGLIGSRLARPAVARYGEPGVLRRFGTLRACWSLPLAFVPALDRGGIAYVIAVELVLITCVAIFTPVFAAVRLQRLPDDRTARALAAWQVSGNATIAAFTALWGVLAALTSVRFAIGAAGALLLLTPLLLRGVGRRGPLADASVPGG